MPLKGERRLRAEVTEDSRQAGCRLSTETALGSRKVQVDLDYGTGVGIEWLIQPTGWADETEQIKTFIINAAEI